MTWTPPQPVAIEVKGIHAQFSQLLIVLVRLTERQPTRWRKLFEEATTDVGESLELPAVVDDEGITITPTDDALEREVAIVEQRIRLANARYAVEQRLARPPSNPALRHYSATVELHETMSQDIRDRIEAARLTARGMSGVFQSSLWTQETVANDVGVPKQPT